MSLSVSGRLDAGHIAYLESIELLNSYVEDPEELAVRAFYHDEIKPVIYGVCNGKSAFAQKLIMQGYIPLVTATVKALKANPKLTDKELLVELTKVLGEKDVKIFALKHLA